MTSLFERVGGQAIITKVVDKFFELLLADQKFVEFFKDTDIQKQKVKQIQYLTKISGGPHHYEGKDMKEAHQKVKINHEQFDDSWKILEKVFNIYQIKADCITEFKNLFYAVEKDVVNN